jgi:hypothetical protein
MNSVGVSPVTETESPGHQKKQQRRISSLWNFFTTNKLALALSFLLLTATFLLYLPVRTHPFANIDDMGYVYENLHVQEGLTWPTIKWAMLTFDDNNWHPLTWISHSIDCQMFGIDPAGHHLMNALWHSVDAVVLFWVLLLATGYVGRSFMVAALFALHPINVESVAWMAERKTLLSTFFFLLALGAYTWYARRPGVLRYSIVAALFACGLMSKPQIITFPCVLLLWDYWPLRRLTLGERGPALANGRLERGTQSVLNTGPERGTSAADNRVAAFPPKSLWWLVAEKIPLFMICGASALVTMLAQRVGRPQHWPYSASIRLGNAMVAFVRYIGKALWPSKLAILYLHPGTSLKLWQVAAAGVVLLAITALVLLGRRYRYLPVGWLWFLGTLVPTIGLVQVGRQALADRYAYQSFIGLFILICWGVADWVQRRHLSRAVLPAASVAVLLVLAVLTHRQIDFWSDNLTMWSHTLQVTQNNWVAEDMVAGILLSQGHREEAMAHYRVAAVINPEDAGSNLAMALYEQGRGNLPEAIRRYKLALAEMDDPAEQAKVYRNMSIAYRDEGDIADSVQCFSMMKKLKQQAQQR